MRRRTASGKRLIGVSELLSLLMAIDAVDISSANCEGFRKSQLDALQVMSIWLWGSNLVNSQTVAVSRMFFSPGWPGRLAMKNPSYCHSGRIRVQEVRNPRQGKLANP